MYNYPKRNQKFITIKGMIFNLQGACSYDEAINQDYTTTLHSAYNKPSTTKECIYKEWSHWAYCEADATCFSIKSYNSNIFTLHGIVDDGEHKYYVVITPSYNRAFELYI